MVDSEQSLRSLSMHDARAIRAALDGTELHRTRLAPRVEALIALGALIALDGPAASIGQCVSQALAAGASSDEVADVLLVVAPTVGTARIVAAAPLVAAALGYDIDAALLELEPVPKEQPAR